MTDNEKIALLREFEESVWKVSNTCDKATRRLVNPATIDKAEEEYMVVAKKLLALVLGRNPTGREVSLVTMY